MLVQRIRFVALNGRTLVMDEWPDFTPPRSTLHGRNIGRPIRWRGKNTQQIRAMPLDTPDPHLSLPHDWGYMPELA